MKTDSLKRRYNLHVPDGYQSGKKIPLVIGLHGGGGKPERFEKYSQLSKMSNRDRNFIAVFPKGIDKHWNDGRKNVNADVDDIDFFQQLVSHLTNEILLSVDLASVFVIGMSNGGLMAMRIACENTGLIAGIGVVAASMSTEFAAICNKGVEPSPLSMVFVFGDDDTSFLSNGKQVNPVKPSQLRGTHIGIEATVRLFAGRNQCHAETTAVTIDQDTDDGTLVSKRMFTGCTKPVVFFDIYKGGHRWPNTDARNGKIMVKTFNLGLASHDINAAEEILKLFFSNQ